jgi:hypothetical protein
VMTLRCQHWRTVCTVMTLRCQKLADFVHSDDTTMSKTGGLCAQ